MKGMLPSRLEFLAPLLLATTVALVVWMVTATWATFNPQADIVLSSDYSEDNADVTTDFSIPHDDVLPDSVITFTPPEWGVATDDDVTDGTVVGSLFYAPTFGSPDSPCNYSLVDAFTLKDATTSKGTEFVDTGDINAGTWNGFDPACPGGTDRAICQWPGFLSGMFPSLTPRARYYGHNPNINGTGQHFVVNLLVFEPGTTLPDHPSFPEGWGYASLGILNDPTAPAPGPFTDFCTPLATSNIIYGTAGGTPLRTNPSYGGTYTFRIWSRAAHDNDGDGYENAIDTCPLIANVDGNIRSDSVLDPDLPFGDGIDSACDADPTGTCGPGTDDDWPAWDCDGDDFLNRDDNCPFAANPSQQDSDEDGAGDACDPAPNTPFGDTSRPIVVTEIGVDVEGPGTGTATPTPMAVGGIAELPEVPGSSQPPYAAFGGGLVGALLALVAGACCARRRWVR